MLAAGNGLYISLAETPKNSTDGENWTTGTPLPATKYLGYTPCFGNDIFVSIYTKYIDTVVSIITSSDGLAWSEVAPRVSPHCLCFSGSDFVALGTSICYLSSDGLAWTPVDLPYQNYRTWYSVFQFQGRLIAIDQSSYMISTDGGTTWQQRVLISFLDILYRASHVESPDAVILYSQGRTVYHRSTDGTTWTQIDFVANAKVNSITYHAGYFFAFGQTVPISRACAWKSADGITWEEIAYYP